MALKIRTRILEPHCEGWGIPFYIDINYEVRIFFNSIVNEEASKSYIGNEILFPANGIRMTWKISQRI